MMNTSTTIKELATALTKAQSTIRPAQKNATNPFLKSSYADLESVTEAIRDALVDNGLSYVQMPATPAIEYGPAVAMTTRLMHASGEWLEETAVLLIPTEERGKSTMQVAGSAYTYLRRYALSAMLGVVTGEDTDGSQPARQQPNGTRKDSRGSAAPAKQDERPRPTADGAGEMPSDIETVVMDNAPGTLKAISDSIPRYPNYHAVKAALKKIGYTKWPKGHQEKHLRLKMYRALVAYATGRDEEERIEQLAEAHPRDAEEA